MRSFSIDVVLDIVLVVAQSPFCCLGGERPSALSTHLFVWLRCFRPFVCFALVWLLISLPFIQFFLFFGQGNPSSD